MGIKKYVFSLFIMALAFFSMNPVTVFADSPVTSTDFYRAYTDVSIVKTAKEKGVIDQEIANYLHSSKNPIDVKAAVINALGWDLEGKNNAESYVKLIYSNSIDKLDIESLSGDEIFCISYMMALDDYFHVDKALSLMEKAHEKNNTSFTIAIVRSIIKGQAITSEDWGRIWTNTASVLDNKTLVKDMRQEAIDIIVEYMKLYEKYPVGTTITTNRMWGADRYDTSAKICEKGWTQSDYVVIASGEDFPDSLGAAPLAKKYNAPILLNTKDSLLPQVSSQIDRLKAKYAILVGGQGALSLKVEAAIRTKGLDIVRLSGPTRYDTSISIANRVGNNGEIIITTGTDFSDGLSAAPMAAKAGIPIILVPKDTVPDAVKNYLANNKITKTIVLGDTDVISDNVANQFPAMERITGKNKFERNINIINKFSSDISFSKVCIASGDNFPDALSGTAYCALNSEPIILLSNEGVPPVTSSFVASKSGIVIEIDVLGGDASVEDSMVSSTVYQLTNSTKN